MAEHDKISLPSIETSAGTKEWSVELWKTLRFARELLLRSDLSWPIHVTSNSTTIKTRRSVKLFSTSAAALVAP